MKSWLLVIAISACGTPRCQQPVQLNPDTGYTQHAASPGGTGKFYFGREIAEVMDASGAGWLERSNRPKEENSALIVESIGLTPSMVVADVGAGTGYYTFRLASRVPTGKVFAVEIQNDLIKVLNRKIKDSAIHNVQVIKGDTDNTHLPANAIDVAILVDVYHELSYPREVMHSISRSLKADGKLILVEYRGEDPSVAIRPLHKTTFDQLSKEMDANGFVVHRRVDKLPIQHFIVFTKKAHVPR
jgi:ubiquinone/menaquinone biosynthesis C-methylase UbiE